MVKSFILFPVLRASSSVLLLTLQSVEFGQFSFYKLIFYLFLISNTKVIDARGKTLSRGTDNGMAYAKFKAHKFSYLNTTSIGSDYVLTGSECGLVCVNIPSCFSFNLAAFYDNKRKILCELLPSDIYNNSKKFVSSQFNHHYSITVSGKSVKKFLAQKCWVGWACSFALYICLLQNIKSVEMFSVLNYGYSILYRCNIIFLLFSRFSPFHSAACRYLENESQYM